MQKRRPTASKTGILNVVALPDRGFGLDVHHPFGLYKTSLQSIHQTCRKYDSGALEINQ
jgi:hypothetical protein